MIQQEINKKIRVSLAFFFSVSLALMPVLALAAKLNLTSQAQEVGINQEFQVDLFLDTENEEINAVEGKIIFPEDLLELKEIRDGNSIINFWIERPAITRKNTNMNTNKREIVFSGITPGGFVGEKGLIFSIIFQSKNEGEGEIEIQNGKVLLNDGKGTPADLSIFNFQFSIAEEAPVAPLIVEIVKDTDPPEAFIPEIAQDPNIFEGKWFLVFVTQDKGSGVAYYAIHETTRKITRINTKGWTEVESPYILKDQKLRSYIYVKAVDKAGNEKIAVVPPKYPLKWYENYWIWIIIILGVIVLYIIGKILWKKSQNIRKT